MQFVGQTLTQEPQPVQRLADGAVVPIFGVGHDRGQRQPGGSTAAHERQRQSPLFLKQQRRGNPRRGAPRQIADPRLGQIQQGAEGPRPTAGPQRRRHGDLAIGDLAQRAAVLARHADRMRARFRKARFVEDQDARALGQHRPQPTPHDLGVPRRVRDEMLEGLVRRRFADARQHRRHRLARAVAQQPVDILAQGHVLGAMPEALLEVIQPMRQASQQRPRVPIEHRVAAYRQSPKGTMSSIQITRGFLPESCEVTKSY